MSERRPEQVSGRILRVWTEQIGTTLAADAAAGATSIVVDDASPLNDDGLGGTIVIGTQTVPYATVDDDTGTVTLSAGLAAAASADDDVAVWDTLYGQVDTVQMADVVVDGTDHNFDPIRAVVSDLIVDLVDGDRGKAAEACVLERDGDEWELVRVKGRPAKARGRKWEDDDVHVLTAAEVTAGSFTHQLSHIPVDESVQAIWRTTPQEPTEFTVSPSGAVSWPLSGFEAAGDRFWFHYQWTDAVATPSVGAEPFVVGTSSVADNATSITLPAGTQAGDTIVLVGSAGWSSAAFSSSDRRMVERERPNPGMAVYVGTADGVQDAVSITLTSGDTLPSLDSAAALVVLRDAAVGASAKVNATSNNYPAPVLPGVRFALALAMASDGLVAGSSLTSGAGWSSVITRRDSKKSVGIWSFQSVAATSTPPGSFGTNGDFSHLSIVTLQLA